MLPGSSTLPAMQKLAATVALFGLVGVACAAATSQPADTFVVVASSDLAVGPQRVLIALLGPDNSSLADPALAAEVEFAPVDHPGAAGSAQARFLWTVPEARGLYAADFTFDVPGTWEATVHREGLAPASTQFLVAEHPATPAPGDAAPRSKTFTTADAQLPQITTDPHPDPRFYELSLDRAFASGRPTVVVFATPAFCNSATCGPTLDTVKSVARGHPQVNFVHVEVYTNLDAASFEELEVVPAVLEWHLPSEPWVFLVDARGVVAARFEGTVAAAELEHALADLG